MVLNNIIFKVFYQRALENTQSGRHQASVLIAQSSSPRIWHLSTTNGKDLGETSKNPYGDRNFSTTQGKS